MGAVLALWGRDRLAVLGFAVVTAFQLWLIFHHAPWFDEAQALLIIRAPLSEIFRSLHYEGHPALWYAYLWLLDPLTGRSPLTLPVAQAGVALAMAWLIWFRAPFELYVRALLATSYFILFEYGVISRSYGLGALLLLIAAHGGGRWRTWLALALACNVSAHFAIAACVLAGLFFLRRPDWRSVVIMGAGLAVSLLTVLPKPADVLLAVPLDVDPLGGLVAGTAGLSAIIAPAIVTVPYRWGALLSPLPSFGVGLMAWVAPAFLLRGGLVKIAWLCSCAAIVYLGAAVYPAFVRHIGALAVLLIALVWMDRGWINAPAPRWFVVWLGGLAIMGVYAAGQALRTPFARGPEIATWLRSHGLEREPIGAWPGAAGAVASLYLDRPVINAQKGCAETYIRWNYDQSDSTRPAERIAASGARLVIAERVIPNARLVAAFPPGLFPKGVGIYRFDSTRPPAPDCPR